MADFRYLATPSNVYTIVTADTVADARTAVGSGNFDATYDFVLIVDTDPVTPPGRGPTDASMVSVDTSGFGDALPTGDTVNNAQKLAQYLNDNLNITPPVSTPNDFRYGLSDQSDPALVDFASLTDVANPTDPQTVSTGLTTAGQYFHIFSANTHDINTITDTVLQQIVYQDGGTGNIFTKDSDTRTESSVTYDAYTVGPLNAGVNEEYIVRFL